MKYTPGPWEAFPGPSNQSPYDPMPADVLYPSRIQSQKGHIDIAYVYATDLPDGRANMALIVLAPDLLEAAHLKRNSRWSEDKKFEGEWVVIPLEDFQALSAIVARIEKGEES